MMIKLFKDEEQISIDKCIKLCFHVQIISANCFYGPFSPLSRKVYWHHEVLTDGIENNCNTHYTGTQHLSSKAD